MSVPRSCWRLTARTTSRFSNSNNLRTPSWANANSSIPPFQRRCMAFESSRKRPAQASEHIPIELTVGTPVAQKQTIKGSTTTTVYPEIPGGYQVQDLLEPHDEILINNGIPSLYSPAAFKEAYADCQSHMLTELNKQVAEKVIQTAYNEEGMRHLIFSQAKKDPALFNYASMVWNNAFYFKGLKYGIEGADRNAALSNDMTRVIERDYFSLSNLKSEFLAQAKAMFGPGFVWLVMRENKRGKQNYFGDDQRRLGILCTYGAGSPLSGAHFRAQKDKDRIQFPGGKATLTAERIAQNATLDAVPILCVSTWQHSYIRDFGVGGKERFLEAWWDSINWGVAEEKVRIDNIPQPTKRPNEEKGYLMKKLDLSTGM